MTDICRQNGEPYHRIDYLDCEDCTQYTCPINHILTRIEVLERKAGIHYEPEPRLPISLSFRKPEIHTHARRPKHESPPRIEMAKERT